MVANWPADVTIRQRGNGDSSSRGTPSPRLSSLRVANPPFARRPRSHLSDWESIRRGNPSASEIMFGKVRRVPRGCVAGPRRRSFVTVAQLRKGRGRAEVDKRGHFLGATLVCVKAARSDTSGRLLRMRPFFRNKQRKRDGGRLPFSGHHAKVKGQSAPRRLLFSATHAKMRGVSHLFLPGTTWRQYTFLQFRLYGWARLFLEGMRFRV